MQKMCKTKTLHILILDTELHRIANVIIYWAEEWFYKYFQKNVSSKTQRVNVRNESLFGQGRAFARFTFKPPRKNGSLTYLICSWIGLFKLQNSGYVYRYRSPKFQPINTWVWRWAQRSSWYGICPALILVEVWNRDERWPWTRFELEDWVFHLYIYFFSWSYILCIDLSTILNFLKKFWSNFAWSDL